MDDFAGFSFNDVDVALGGASDDVVTEDREHCGGGRLLVLGSRNAVAEWCGGKDVFDRNRIRDIHEVWEVFEQACNEEIAVVGVQLSHVDRSFEFDNADAFLSLEVPEECSTILRR